MVIKLSKDVVVYHSRREVVTPSIPNNAVNLVIEDPPYGLRKDELWDNRQYYIKNLREWLWEGLRISKHAVIWFCGTRTMPYIFKAIHGHENLFYDMYIWRKPLGSQYTGAARNNIWYSMEIILVFSKNHEITSSYGKEMPYNESVFEYRPVTYNEYLHPTSKPLALIRKLIGHFSNKGEVIFDGFGGSMTTAVAAIEMGRRIIACEMMPLADKDVCEDPKNEAYNPDYIGRGIKRIKECLDSPRLFVGENDE